MDALHCELLRQVASLPGIRRIIEVGSYLGVSTKALMDSPAERILLHELYPEQALKDLIRNDDRVILLISSYPADPKGADLIFIDADHGEGALHDVIAALAMEIPIIVMHDSQLKEGWGSRAAVKILKNSSRRWVEDAKEREGMRTDRGLFVSVSKEVSHESWSKIWEIFHSA